MNVPASNEWRTVGLVVGLTCVVLLWALSETTLSLFDMWWNSDTYAHGLLIVPISLWLIWRKRHLLHDVEPRPAPGVLVLFAAGLAGWMVARLVGVLVVEQLALVYLVITLVWSLVGHRAARLLAFPLLFLFFSVPMGEDLIPPMMEFTASFTVWMLQVTGIPVYREGLYFVIPSGSWSVVEACSGVRYLIASVTLGFLYAYLTYRALWRRLIFIALSIVVPVFANGLRAYMIVMLAHLSGMKLATGVDHLIYGWVFFGIVMLILFWVGSFWSEPTKLGERRTVSETGMSDRPKAAGSGSLAHFAVAAVIVAASISTQAAVNYVSSKDAALAQALESPAGAAGWVLSNQPSGDWSPYVLATEHRLSATYRKGIDQVRVEAFVYPVQKQDAEAVNSQNRVVKERDTPWRIVERKRRVLTGSGGVPSVNSYRVLRGAAGDTTDSNGFLAWQWYRLGARATSHSYIGKALAGVNLIYPGRQDGAYVVLATGLGSGEAYAEDVLQTFVAEMGPELNRAIDAAVIGPALR